MKLYLYEIDPMYVKYLSQFEKEVYWSDGDKANRKYIGIVIEVNGVKYFAPLTSFKLKHKTMKETVDMIKISDYAVINLNKMIPVPMGIYRRVEFRHIRNESYKALLELEYREICKKANKIKKNANVVYNHKTTMGNSTALAKRCNDFEKLEKLYKGYI